MKKLVVLFLGGILLASCNQPKIAYVDNVELTNQYEGIKAIEKKFEKKANLLSTNLDSLAKSYQSQVQKFKETAQSMSASERKEKGTKLMKMRQQLLQERNTVSQLLQKQQTKARDSLMKVIKGFIKDYGEKHNYTYILGSTELSNILYAKDAKNITDEVVKALNEKFDNESK